MTKLIALNGENIFSGSFALVGGMCLPLRLLADLCRECDGSFPGYLNEEQDPPFYSFESFFEAEQGSFYGWFLLL